MGEGNMEFFTTRHSVKPKGEDKESQIYTGISESGVELAKKRSQEDILTMIEQAPEGAVVFIGGASDQVRTKSTAEAYGDGLAEIAIDKADEMQIITQEEIFAMIEDGDVKAIDKIKEIVNANPEKKMVIDFPMFLKEFAMGSRWLNKDGSLNPFMQRLMEKNNNDDFAAMKEWIESEGRIEDLVGPNPTEVAKEQLEGLKRLHEFASKQITNRPLIIGFVGHSFHMDILTIYLANQGRVDLEGLEKLGGTMTKETEMARIKIEDGKATLLYRDQEFDIDQKI